MKTALVAGATGLVGRQLLALLLADDYYSVVKTITRKKLEMEHPRLINLVVDFDNLPHDASLKADDVFCCLGTTMKQAGSKGAFRKVDFHYPEDIALITKKFGAQQYLMISALGADKNSSIFYNKVKGEAEEAIKAVDFSTVHIYRPSLLLGPREEERTGEDAAKVFFKVAGFLIPKKYKPIDSLKVAKAMHSHAKSHVPGIFVHDSAELQGF